VAVSNDAPRDPVALGRGRRRVQIILLLVSAVVLAGLVALALVQQAGGA
jgi:hypothetical protein